MSDRGRKSAKSERALREAEQIRSLLGAQPEDLIGCLHRLADQHNAVAQYSLGNIYASQGDDAEAVKWFRRAAEQGDAEAQFSLGELYEEGQLLSKDFAQTVKSQNRGTWMLNLASDASMPTARA